MATLQLGNKTLFTQSGSNPIEQTYAGPNHTFTIKAENTPIVDSQQGAGAGVSNATSDQLAIYNGATKLWGITEGGYIVNPNVPSFLAYADSDGSGANAVTPLKYESTIHNIGNCYSTTTYAFTAPISGLYFFSYSIWTNNASTTRCAFYVNGVGVGRSSYPIGTRNNASSAHNDSASIILSISSGDSVDIRCYAGAPDLFGTNYFTGHLVG